MAGDEPTGSPADPTISGPVQWVLLTAGFAAIVLLLYGPAASFPFLDWDDSTFIVTNPHVYQPLSTGVVDQILTPALGYPAPLTVAVQSALLHLGDGSPLPFHVLNLALHLVVAVLLVGLVVELGGRQVLAVCTGLLFVVHPLVVEPTCWAMGLKDLLSAALVLIGTIAVVRLERATSSSAWLLPVLVGLAACFAKPTACLAPLSWLVYLTWGPSGWPSRQQLTHRPVRLIAAGAVMGFVLLAVAAFRHHTLTEGSDTLAFHWATPVLALGHQLENVVWPTDLHPVYPLGWGDTTRTGTLAVGVVGLLALATIVVWARRRRELLMPLSAAVFTYVPVSQLVPFPRITADAYFYMPLAFVLVALAVGVARSPRPWVRHIAAAIFATATIAVVPTTSAQVARWSGDEALWRPVTERWPGWAQGWILLGQGRSYAGDHDGAARAYVQAFQRRFAPDQLSAFALVYLQLDDPETAQCIMVVDVLYGPDAGRAQLNLATLLASQPDVQILHREAAQRALSAVANHRTELPWPDEWKRRLDQRLDEVQGVPPRSLSPRDCPPLSDASLPP